MFCVCLSVGFSACFSSYRIARNLVVPKNTPPEKDAGTLIMISIFSRNLESHALTVWKNTSMLMKPKIGRGALCACYGFMKRALKSDVLTN